LAGAKENQAFSGLLISDFNIDNFAAYLRTDSSTPILDISAVPFGQVSQALLSPDHSCWRSDLDFVVIWTRPEAVLPSFGDLLTFSDVATKQLTEQVDEYARHILAIKNRAKNIFVPTWVVPTLHQGHGLLDLAPETGIARAVMEVNLRLLQNLDGASNVFALNASKWIEIVGDKAFNARLWYLAKIPFSNEVFKVAARDLKSALRGIRGSSRKLVVVDLDDTLWGGIVGEEGWEGITLGGHDAVGEAYVDFQRELKTLTHRGIVLAVVSKNEESVALEAVQKHPEMILSVDDFAGWRINWHDKATNLASLVDELNLGLDSVVFIDDNPVERARVRDALPDVLVPEWPTDPRLYPQALRHLDCFDKPTITDEDRHRPEMYVTERRRVTLRQQARSVEEWLKDLSMVVTVEPLDRVNLARVAQLLNKTNQFNLTTRRVSEAELSAWVAQKGHQLWAFRVKDKFGDSGLSAVASAEIDGHRARLVDFVLSCRVMGRRVEETIVHVAVQWARAAHLEELQAIYKPTPKNKPCLEFLNRSGLRSRGAHLFVWPIAEDYKACPVIQLVYKAASNEGQIEHHDGSESESV
jgi:FkbH-like protein